ncbi:TPA: DotA/TraY family protein [Pasteurella multocida]|nr:DotA/TraY family protein [Pasteurella multocida]HED4445199.1 DotA/TraY family protein [Pasteurella multocida]
MDIFKPEVVKNDFLIENILKPIFSYQSNEISPYSQIFGIFSMSILVVAAVLLIVSFVQKTMNTAADGTLKHIQATTILRWLIGLVLLLPVPPSNFSLGVQGVVWLAGQGVNLANVAYEKWDLNTTLTNKDLSYNTNYNNQLLSVLKTAVSSHLCINSAAENLSIHANGSKPNFAVKSKSYKTDQVVYNFGDFGSKYIQDHQICGSLTISYPAEAKSRTPATDQLIQWADQSLVNDTQLKNSLKQSHIQAMNNLVSVDAANIAKSIKTASTEQLSSMIENALKNYNNTIKATFNNLSIFNKEASNKMKENGIAAAGAWFFKVSLINQQVNKALNNLPAVNSMKTSSDNEKNCSWYNFLGTNCSNAKKLAEYSTQISADQKIFDLKFTDSLKHLSANSADKKIATAAAQDKKSDAESDFLDLFKPVTSLDFNRLNYIDQTTKSIGNPLVKIQSIGQDIATGVQSVILGMIAFSWTGLVTAVAVAVVVTPFLLGLLIPALALAFYIPLLPFITWLGALVGWIVMLALSIFGVPLWLLAHLIPDQQGLIGRTGQGYMLILELFLKPVLLFAGYLSALFLLNPVMLLLNSFFGFAAESIFDETSSFLYVLYLISIFAIYFVIVNQLLKLLLNLMTEIPDSLFSWLGTNLNKTLSNYGHQLDERSNQAQGTVLAHSVAGLGQISNGLNSLFKKSHTDNNKEQKELNKYHKTDGQDLDLIKKSADFNVKNVATDKQYTANFKKAEKTDLTKQKEHVFNSNTDVNLSKAEKADIANNRAEFSTAETVKKADVSSNSTQFKQAQTAEKIDLAEQREQALKAKAEQDLNLEDSELSAYKKKRIKDKLNVDIA